MTKYEEVIAALSFYFGLDELNEDDKMKSINEIIRQCHEPIETIAQALQDYNDCKGEKQ